MKKIHYFFNTKINSNLWPDNSIGSPRLRTFKLKHVSHDAPHKEIFSVFNKFSRSTVPDFLKPC